MRTRTASLSTTGAWIGAALAISTQAKPPAAAAPANAAEAFRKSRRLNLSVMVSSCLATSRLTRTNRAHRRSNLSRIASLKKRTVLLFFALRLKGTDTAARF